MSIYLWERLGHEIKEGAVDSGAAASDPRRQEWSTLLAPRSGSRMLSYRCCCGYECIKICLNESDIRAASSRVVSKLMRTHPSHRKNHKAGAIHLSSIPQPHDLWTACSLPRPSTDRLLLFSKDFTDPSEEVVESRSFFRWSFVDWPVPKMH